MWRTRVEQDKNKNHKEEHDSCEYITINIPLKITYHQSLWWQSSNMGLCTVLESLHTCKYGCNGQHYPLVRWFCQPSKMCVSTADSVFYILLICSCHCDCSDLLMLCCSELVSHTACNLMHFALLNWVHSLTSPVNAKTDDETTTYGNYLVVCVLDVGHPCV